MPQRRQPPHRPQVVAGARASRPAWADDAPMPPSLPAIAVGAALVAVGAAQIADLLTFQRLVALAGLQAELNPLVARAADVAGLPILVAAKLALVVLVVAVFAIVARAHRRTAAFVATFGTGAGLLGAFSNVLALL